jgi:hypothetical protein
LGWEWLEEIFALPDPEVMTSKTPGERFAAPVSMLGSYVHELLTTSACSIKKKKQFVVFDLHRRTDEWKARWKDVKLLRGLPPELNDSVDDILIARAAAEIPRNGFSHLRVIERPRAVLAQQRRGGHYEARSTKAAL